MCNCNIDVVRGAGSLRTAEILNSNYLCTTTMAEITNADAMPTVEEVENLTTIPSEIFTTTTGGGAEIDITVPDPENNTLPPSLIVGVVVLAMVVVLTLLLIILVVSCLVRRKHKLSPAVTDIGGQYVNSVIFGRGINKHVIFYTIAKFTIPNNNMTQ